MFVLLTVLLGTLAGASVSQRLTGVQGAIANNTLWLFGGDVMSNDGSIFSSWNNLTKIDLTQKFDARASGISKSMGRQPGVPNVSFGTMWSNQINALWLYNGESLWKFNTETETWTENAGHGDDPKNIRRVGGTGINVPSIATGYYLGGHSADGNPANPTYFHDLVVFHMDTEETSFVELPDFVPILAPGLVYLDIGAEGMLVVLGGKTEKDGVLSYASLQFAYFYDIASGKWIWQQTTDVLGRNDHFYGGYNVYSPGIPSERYNMCTVVGTAPDHTVFNIYIFGGQNDTATPGDIWVLTMPGALWIRMTTDDVTNNPKSGMSCNLIHDRYVLMADGCWIEAENKCLSYGWNPLLYYIIAGDNYMADWRWNYDPEAVGYNVPRQVFEIVGGNPGPWGNAAIRSPRNTAYNGSLLKDAFEPEPSSFVSHCFVILGILLPVFFVIPFLLFAHLQWAVRNVQHEKRQALHNSNARQFSAALLFAFTAALMVIVTILWKISYLEDPDTRSWTGGVEADGLWTGNDGNTTFTPAAGSRRTIKGLFGFYMHNFHPSGQWNRHNAPQRMGPESYFVWTYLPSIVFVLYGILWQIIDGEVKKLEKWRQLSRPGGCPAKQSLCLDYHEFWSPLAILQAIRYRQWAVAFSSTGYVLAAIAIPNIQNYVFTWEIYAGNGLVWGGIFTRQVAYADAFWSKVLIATLALNLACTIGLYWSFGQDQVSIENPRGLAGVASLTIESFQKIQSVFATASINPANRNSRFKIDTPNDSNHLQLFLIDGDKEPSRITSPSAMARQVTTRIAKLQWFVRLRGQTKMVPWRKMFDLALLVSWNIGLVLTLSAACYILRQMTSPAQLSAQNYRLPWSPNLYLVVGVFVQSLYQVLERRIRAVTVFLALSTQKQRPRILFEDWSNTIPVVETVQALRCGHFFLAFTLFGTVVSVVYTIMLGSLQVSASFYGATTFHADLDGVAAVVALNAYLLILSLAALVAYIRRVWDKEWNVGGQSTLAAALAFTLWSVKLREDMRGVREITKKHEKIRELQGSRYSFQKLRDDTGNDHNGVEKI